MVLLSDDIGSIVTFALMIGGIVTVLACFFAFNMIIRSKGKRVLISIIIGVCVLFLVVWLILNTLGSF